MMPSSEIDQSEPALAEPDTFESLGADESRRVWAEAGREVLVEAAKSYRSVVTSKDLAAAVMDRTGIRTKQQGHYWIGDVLSRISAQNAEADEPLLASLCVNAQGAVASGYAAAVTAARGTAPKDADDHAAQERLACHVHFGAVLPPNGGTASLTPRLAQSRSRLRRTTMAERPPTICPTCTMVIPPTGVCDNCG